MSGRLSKRQALRVASITGIGAGATLGMGGVAHAGIAYTVGTTDDTSSVGDCASDNNDCSLRQAITLANGNAGADIINFHSGLTGTIALGSDLPTITDPVTITGPGANAITIDGQGAHRIFEVKPTTPGATVLIGALTLTGGDPGSSATNPGVGGAVLNETAHLSLGDAVITGNTAENLGTAIYSGCDAQCGLASGVGANASLTLARVSVSGNDGGIGGGAGTVYLNYGGATIFSSTINGNSTTGGGGISIFQMASPVTIENTTIKGNSANGLGGGIYMDTTPGQVTIENSTIAGNTGFTGGGIYDLGELVNPQPNLNPVLKNTIVATNTATSGAGPDLVSGMGSAFDSAFSLIGNTAEGTINETVPGSDLTGANPMLGPLANNGGDTLTMAPQAGSPVIDKGSGFGVGVDQRGLIRPVDLPDYKNSTAAGADGSDIGAVELQTSPGGGDVVAPSTPATPRKKCKKKKKHKRSASAAKKKCKKKKKK